MAKLVLVVAIIVSLGALFGAVGYLAKNKQVKIQQPQISPVPEPNATNQIIDETADWEILNGSFNYTIKYPSEFYVKKGFHGEAEIEYISDQISSVENPASQNMLESFRFSISRRKNIEKDNLNSIYGREINMLAREKIATSVPFEGKVEKVRFGKLEGVKTTRMWELTKQEVKSKEKSIYVYLISDDYAYVLMGNISQFAKQGEFDNLVRVMDKMLNTFKFIEK